ncbi:MAG: hypothetical protein RLZ83_549 [Pseudomonadota bacterium]|jgi:hypothetical protein
MSSDTDALATPCPTGFDVVSAGLARSFDVADAVACARWASRVLSLRDHWTPRHPHYPFHTLGLAAYLDAVRQERFSKGQSLYRSKGLRRHYNDLLRTHFADLLTAGAQALATMLGMPTRYDEARAALPGFHIHLPHAAFAQEVASVHRDLQFMEVFPEVQPTPAEVFTFTLPLSLPAGAGIHFWVEGQRHFFAYALGRMLVHDGLITHQAVLHPLMEDTPRIMWQGHGIAIGGELILYW